MQFSPKSQRDLFVDTDKIILKFIWKGKRTRIAKKSFEKEYSKRNQCMQFQDL